MKEAKENINYTFNTKENTLKIIGVLKKYGENKTINLFNLALGGKKEELKIKINIKSSTSTFSKINTQSKYYNIKSLILNSR